jgi:single-stranded-DNA-specific exonuclease
LESAHDVIEAGGGHEMAAGVSVREEKLEEFRIAFVKNVAEQAENDTLIPKLVIDREIMFKDLNLDLLDSYELLRPFGAGNPQPLFMSRGIELVQEPRVIKEKHLKYRFYQNGTELEGIYFNGLEKDIPKPAWDIAYTIDRNEWRGRVKLNLVIQAIRKAG